jgi:8-oxo-dGTP diphosphatase
MLPQRAQRGPVSKVLRQSRHSVGIGFFIGGGMTTIALSNPAHSGFRGTKLILFAGNRLVTLLRDDKPSIPWPNYWDFPGGGREKGETAVQCTLRETREGIGLDLSESHLKWSQLYFRADHYTWFFGAQLPKSASQAIHLGTEGQKWQLMSPREYLTHRRGIPHFQARLADYLASS